MEGDLPDSCPVCGSLSVEFEGFGPFYSASAEHLGQWKPLDITDILQGIPSKVESLITKTATYGVFVAVGVGVLVLVGVEVSVGAMVLVGVLVAVRLGIVVAVLLGVAVALAVPVAVRVAVGVAVAEVVGVAVDVAVRVAVAVGVDVAVLVLVAVAVFVDLATGAKIMALGTINELYSMAPASHCVPNGRV